MSGVLLSEVDLFKQWPRTKESPELWVSRTSIFLFNSVPSFRTVNIKITLVPCFLWPIFPERTEDPSSWTSWPCWALERWTEGQGQKPSSLCNISACRFPGGCLMLESWAGCAATGLGWWPSWVLSFIFGPFPCPSGPGHKAGALEHIDSR